MNELIFFDDFWRENSKLISGFSLLCFALSLQIVIPVFGDQPSNGLEAQSRGYGISIPLPELTTENLQEAVDRVLSDPTFSQKAQEHGAMVMDQINTPLERAVWWLEYAMRYPGMKHMRSPVHDLHWTQYLLLDVIAFFIGIFLILCGTCFSVCKCFCRKRKID